MLSGGAAFSRLQPAEGDDATGLHTANGPVISFRVENLPEDADLINVTATLGRRTAHALSRTSREKGIHGGCSPGFAGRPSVG
jgi:hypothetical protein